MATIEHCLYCFEALAAHLEDRKSMTLAELEDSYADYLKALSAEAASAPNKPITKRHPALERLSRSSSGTSSPVSPSSASSSSSTLSLQQPASGISTPATSISSSPATPRETDNKILESPLFVTWNKKSSSRGDYGLRGCIGTFEPQELDEGLSSYALTSALHDTRFHPVSAREIPSLQVAVTLLTDFEDADDADDWEVGTHGLRISFVHRGRRYGSTYLPDVAVEQGWTKEETVVSLMRKAGWTGRKDAWREVALKVVRYQGKREDCDYEEYKAWRDWVEKSGGE